MKPPFAGRTYLITGAAQGIGCELIKQLAAEGANVFFTYYQDEDHAKSLVEGLRSAAGTVDCMEQDARTPEGAKKVVDSAIKRFGRIDGLINNAGYKLDRSFIMMQEEDWNDQIAVNLNSVYYYSRAVAYHMVRQKYGRIICMGAVSGPLIAGPYQVAYGASKAGLVGFTKSLAFELARFNVTVNMVTGGMIDTAGMKFPQDIRKVWADHIPLQRLGKADEVASLVKYLLTPLSDYITGQNFVIDGGMTLLGFTKIENMFPRYNHGMRNLGKSLSLASDHTDP
ncbi:SDR family oxidoreductase [Kroppenstedtia pulmonis]|uniref:SDR family oxidoreductase n=1 Tax=Kroppenstedtia pulmonis TaxID=1380685 RepID=A0A7D3XP25_9BACL|nr:SDR family NAD(P)-dependent oxidoreductase [Kroppenstedtia pulmonis]QKG83262.1 SDR family oxidoreductase [Kroppenstedtia pulmonis]